MSIFLPSVDTQLAPGLTKWEFSLLDETAFSFRPTVINYNRASIKKEGYQNEAETGIGILVKDYKDSEGKYDILIKHPGDDSQKATKATKEDQANLMDYIHELAIKSEPQELPDWKKAILICDWESDIAEGTAKSGNQGQRYRDAAIDEIMIKEVSHLSIFLFEKLTEFAENLHLNVLGDCKENYFLPNPNLPRYNYYIDVVVQAILKITGKGR